MSRDETIEAIRVATWDDGLISSDEAATIYDRFIFPMMQNVGRFERERDGALNRIAAQEALMQRAIEALEPFAKAADELEETAEAVAAELGVEVDYDGVVTGLRHPEATRARAVLAELRAAKEAQKE